MEWIWKTKLWKYIWCVSGSLIQGSIGKLCEKTRSHNQLYGSFDFKREKNTHQYQTLSVQWYGVLCWNCIFIDLPFSMISSVYVCLRKINATSWFNSVLLVRSLFRTFKYDQNRNFRLTAAIYQHCPRIETTLL